MGSPSTRPTIAARWPRGAEGQRREIRAAADALRDLIVEAHEANADGNKLLIKALLAMIDTCAADIQRLAVEARVGPEPSED